LDELFEAAPDAAIAAEAGPAPISAEAPTWTAMPVVPVRSDTTPVAARPQRNPLISAQLRSDALAAWHGTRRRTQDWLRQQDNALIALTAIVAILLIVVVAALGH
jgi:hypothetical protein